MGQCCSSKNKSKIKSNKRKTGMRDVSTNTFPGSYYEDNYIEPVSPNRHMFTQPAPATPEGTTESVVNRDVHEAVMSHFCNCSISIRCPHRPRVTPLRNNRKYSQDLRRQLQSPVVHQNRCTNKYLSEGQWNLTLGAPFASSSRLDTITSSSRLEPNVSSSGLNPIASSSRLEHSSSAQTTCQNKLRMSWDLNNSTYPLDEEDDEEIYGYSFVPRERTIAFEKSIIEWV